MKRVLITTTINVPHNLTAWRNAGFDDTDVFIVAGDMKTPHDDVRKLLETLPGDNRYLHPDNQTYWASSMAIGWNSIQRRNIALLEAIKLNPTNWIITVDDDNWPMEPNQAQHIDRYLCGNSANNYLTVFSESGWWNCGSMLEPPVVHRGYPISLRPLPDLDPSISYEFTQSTVGVLASLWIGDPDIDAIQRLFKKIDVISCNPQNHLLAKGTWCPFNSQATAYLTNLAPLMSVWPGIGRYDDIWSSYMARAVMDRHGYHVMYGHPTVRQGRNQHNLLHDLHEELHGYRHTEELCDKLRNAPLGSEDLIVDLAMAMQCVRPIVPHDTNRFFTSWIWDIEQARIR